MVKSFMTGVIVGGATVWVWGPAVRSMVNERTQRLRDRAAERLHEAAEGLESAAVAVKHGRNAPSSVH